MVLSLLWIVTLTAPLIALMLSAGCAALPRPVSETELCHDRAECDGYRTFHLTSPGQYWKRDQSREIKLGPAGIVSIIERAGPPDEELTRGRRVAITEFSVEFVEVQFQNPFGHPTIDQIFFLPRRLRHRRSRLAWSRAALERRQQRCPTADQIHTSQALHDVFERHLKENGLIIVPQNTVTACAGYSKLKPSPSISSSWARFLKPVSTDTGVVLRTHTVAAPGLGVATCGSSALASAEAEIKRETGADVVMAVKLRVGTYHQKAALEQNSTIRWTAANGSIILTAQKSLVSDADVTDVSRFIPCRLAVRAGPHRPSSSVNWKRCCRRLSGWRFHRCRAGRVMTTRSPR